MAPSHLRRGEARSRLRRHKAVHYQEDDSLDDDGDDDNNLGRSPLPTASRPTRASTRLQSYRESDTSDDGSQSPQDSDPAPTSPFEHERAQGRASDRSTRTRSSTRSNRRTRLPPSLSTGPKRRVRATSSVTSISSPKRRKIETVNAREDTTNDIQYSGPVPKWQDLPYHILLQVFTYASRPLYNAFSRRNPSVQWLLDTSLLCRSFHEAAISTLLYSPPISPVVSAHALLALLSRPQAELTLEYRNKVRCLDIETRQVLIRKGGPDLGYFDLATLVSFTPQLKALHLYHYHDQLAPSVQRSISSHTKWSYPESLFDALDGTKVLLQSWEWNGRFPDTENVLLRMSQVHMRHAFRTVQSLTLINLSASRKTTKDLDGDAVDGTELSLEESLRAALATLPNLRQLEFRKCSLVNESLLPTLPRTLQRLFIIQCEQLGSGDLQEFLKNQGATLTDLVLDHNQALSLGFLANLASTCPCLQDLKMDLTYYDASSFHDVDPHYDELLPLGQPTWPTTLRSIDLAQLRNWEAPAAEGFFSSLIDAAPELKDLRKLRLKAILTIPWRERASFRNKWIDKLDHVFLRRSKPPMRLQTVSQLGDLDHGSRLASRRTKLEPVRPATAESQSSQSSSFPTDASGPATPSKRKSVRIAKRDFDPELQEQLVRRSACAAVVGEADDETSPQGMCDEVTVRIDNLRPAEAQFDEGDFLDDEATGDEDWNGYDPVPAAGYAW